MVRGDAIARIARGIQEPATRVIDAAGLTIATGFIDIHTHARRGLFDVPTADNYVRQGVTTLIEGPDGRSPRPTRTLPRHARPPAEVGEHRDVHRPGIDSIGSRRRSESSVDFGRDREDARAGRSGNGPGTFTPTAEVVELATVAGRLGGIFISHMRNEAAGVVDSVTETIAIGERGDLPTQVTHHKIIGKPYWGEASRRCV